MAAMSGMTFELDTPHGRMMAGIAQFERDVLSERVKSGLAAARARGQETRLPARPAPKFRPVPPPRCSMPSTAGGAIVGSPATSASARTRICALSSSLIAMVLAAQCQIRLRARHRTGGRRHCRRNSLTGRAQRWQRIVVGGLGGASTDSPRASPPDDGRVQHCIGAMRNRDASLFPGTRLRGTGRGSGSGARHGSAGRVAIAGNDAPRCAQRFASSS